MSIDGLFFMQIDKHRRSVYEQSDGKIILADECRCSVKWEAGRAIRYALLDCPIERHQIEARQLELSA